MSLTLQYSLDPYSRRSSTGSQCKSLRVRHLAINGWRCLKCKMGEKEKHGWDGGEKSVTVMKAFYALPSSLLPLMPPAASPKYPQPRALI